MFQVIQYGNKSPVISLEFQEPCTFFRSVSATRLFQALILSGYVASVSYDNFQYITTQPIPGDSHFPIVYVTGTGIAPPFALEGAALYASRGSANASKGGDVYSFIFPI